MAGDRVFNTKSGSVTATIWRNQSKDGGTYDRIQLQKSKYDRDTKKTEYQDDFIMYPSDAAALAAVFQTIHVWSQLNATQPESTRPSLEPRSDESVAWGEDEWTALSQWASEKYELEQPKVLEMLGVSRPRYWQDGLAAAKEQIESQMEVKPAKAVGF